MSKQNLSGTPGTRTDVTDLSIITANKNKGVICVLAALKRGLPGKFVKVGNDVQMKRKLGGLIANNDDALIIQLALEAGAVLNVGRLFHLSDIDDIGTIDGTKAQAVIASSIAEVLAKGSFEITGGSSNPGTNTVATITVNGVDVLGGAVNWVTGNEETATAVALAITNNASVPNYNAVAVGNKVELEAVAGSGATPNGFVVAGTVTGDVTIGNEVAMAGGVSAGAINMTLQGEAVGDGYNGATIETKVAKSRKAGYVDFYINLPDSDLEAVLRDVDQFAVSAPDIININARLRGVDGGVAIASITGSIPVGLGTLAGGVQDLSQLVAADYTGSKLSQVGLHVFDGVKDSMRIFNINKAVPEIDQAFADYCASRKDMRGVGRTPLGLSITGIGDYRNGSGAYVHQPIDTFYYDLWYTDGEITDPSDIDIKDKVITNLAFKLASRSIKDRKGGEWLSDSGDQSPIPFSKVNRVPVNLLSPAYNEDYGDIYEAGLNAIVDHDTYGVVPWGNRSCYRDTTSLLSKMNIADLVVIISRTLKSLASGKNFAPNDIQMFKELYRKVRPAIVDWVDGRAIEGESGGTRGEGKWWHWFGDQDANSLDELSFNDKGEVDASKYRCRFAFKPIAANEYIAIDIAPADSATILNVQILQTI